MSPDAVIQVIDHVMMVGFMVFIFLAVMGCFDRS